MEDRIEEKSSPLNTDDVLSAWNAEVSSEAPKSAGESSNRAYRAIFFDLDGTLLAMELEYFLSTYFKSIGAFVSKHGLDPQQFSAGFKAGTQAMTSCHGTKTNCETFWAAFFQQVDRTGADWESVLLNYYEEDFARIGEDVVKNPAAARAISTLASKGYTLLLTTMPLFPRRAVEHRLAWAGVEVDKFARITTYENSTSVKPKLSYYAENLAACGIAGEDILMVGNNTVEDLSAMQLGADAFLITDNLIDPVGYDLDTIKNGSMEQFAAWADTLPPCAHPVVKVISGVVEGSLAESVLLATVCTDTPDSSDKETA